MPASRSPQHPSIAAEWSRRIEAEYRSAALTQHLGLWLLQLGASPDLVRAAARITRDELAHAELSARVFAAAGGEGLPALSEGSLSLSRRHDALVDDVAIVGVELFCLGETVAVPLFAEMRRRCTAPAARRALDRVLRDEVRHRDFGWTLLGWLLELSEGPRLRALVSRELPAMFGRQARRYTPPPAEAETTLSTDEHAWGLLAPANYGEILARTVERDYAPRFQKVGIDARAAWRARR